MGIKKINKCASPYHLNHLRGFNDLGDLGDLHVVGMHIYACWYDLSTGR